MTTMEAEDLYRKMYLIRACELMGARWSREGRTTSPPHFSVGSEAMAVGVCAALKHDAIVYAGHRCHAPFLAKGGRVSIWKEALLGNYTQAGATGSMHMADPEAGVYGGSAIIGGHLPIAAGVAWACKMEGTGRRVVCFTGEAAWDCGYFWETWGIALRKRLPLLIVVEENGISTATPARSPLRRHMEAPTASGSAVEDVTEEASCCLRALPAIMCVTTERWCAHAGGELRRPPEAPGDPLRWLALEPDRKRAIEEKTDAYLREYFE